MVEIVDTNKAADKERERGVKCCKGKVAPLASVASPRKDIMEFARYTYRNEWTKAYGSSIGWSAKQ